MKLSNLIKGTGLKPIRFSDVDIRGISENSRDVREGFLFFCVKGFRLDGHSFIGDAVRKGASAVVVSRREEAERVLRLPGVAVLYSGSPREDLSLLSLNFFGKPHRRVNVIGITGTNGKTTTSYIIYSILNRIGESAGLIGTVEYRTEKWSVPASRTTPSPIEFNRLLKRMADEGVRWAVCEVSSHALELQRVFGIRMKAGVFTNLSQDHLDFHGDMESYFLSKFRMMDHIGRDGVFLTNVDDSYGRLIYGLRGIFGFPVMSYGKKGKFRLTSWKGGEVVIGLGDRRFRVRTNLKGEHNAYNVLSSFSTLFSIGFEGNTLEGVPWNVKVPGRLEEVERNIFVDYAHTPDALMNVLKALRTVTEGKLIVVFGCGGERDREKRPMMGRVSTSIADVVIITSDNPRGEDPERIAGEILSGTVEGSNVEVILNRRDAIRRGIELKGEKDILLIAGKGHEPYQEVSGKKIPFSDSLVVREIIDGSRRAC